MFQLFFCQSASLLHFVQDLFFMQPFLKERHMNYMHYSITTGLESYSYYSSGGGVIDGSHFTALETGLFHFMWYILPHNPVIGHNPCVMITVNKVLSQWIN